MYVTSLHMPSAGATAFHHRPPLCAVIDPAQDGIDALDAEIRLLLSKAADLLADAARPLAAVDVSLRESLADLTEELRMIDDLLESIPETCDDASLRACAAAIGRETEQLADRLAMGRRGVR